MKLLVDMNLSPRWTGMLAGSGFEAVHWSTLGAMNAPDPEIMAYARMNNYVVLNPRSGFRRDPRRDSGRETQCGTNPR